MLAEDGTSDRTTEKSMKNQKTEEPSPLALFVATQVLRRRKAKRLTQAELAARAGITVESVARLERVLRGKASGNANPCLDTLSAIASSLGCHAADLLDGRNEGKKNDPLAAMLRLAKPATRRHLTVIVEALLKAERADAQTKRRAKARG
jgi:transcriptional regulator with XRE-family HTH domain